MMKEPTDEDVPLKFSGPLFDLEIEKFRESYGFIWKFFNARKGKINLKKKEAFFACLDILDAINLCYTFSHLQAARSLCRTIIEISVKSNLGIPLDNEVKPIKDSIQKTTWKPSVKKMAVEMYDSTKKFVHYNPEQIKAITMKFAREQTNYTEAEPSYSLNLLFSRRIILDIIKIMDAEFLL